MKKEMTRNEQILFDYERLCRNGAQLARMYNLSRQRIHHIVLSEAKKLGRKPKWYKSPDKQNKNTEYYKEFHER